MFPKKEPMTKKCIICGTVMIQPRWKNGDLDSSFSKRKFCSKKCYGISIMKKNPTLSAIRKRYQRKISKNKCAICGIDANLHVHHKDRNPKNNTKENIMILCSTCHAKVHIDEGTWGKRKRLKNKVCPICKTEFSPRKYKSKLCKNKKCHREWSRISMIRFHEKMKRTSSNPGSDSISTIG